MDNLYAPIVHTIIFAMLHPILFIAILCIIVCGVIRWLQDEGFFDPKEPEEYTGPRVEVLTVDGKLAYRYTSKEQADGKINRHPRGQWLRVDELTYRRV